MLKIFEKLFSNIICRESAAEHGQVDRVHSDVSQASNYVGFVRDGDVGK